MPIQDKDIKILWGRAAGMCSMPNCRMKLTGLLDQQDPYHIGEMAHIIAKATTGPRADGEEPDNTYNNLILLCPNHHKQIDKAPNQFPPDLLRQWKIDHEFWVENALSGRICKTNNELRAAVSVILNENFQIWESIGPESELAQINPGSNVYKLWQMRKWDTIIPNNKKIINLVTANIKLLRTNQLKAFIGFKNHAIAFELQSHDRLDKYPRFPQSFATEFIYEE